MREIRLGELVRQVATGAMALPEFQRDFVWDPNKVIELLDSVSNGWPIGSLLLLEGPQPFGIRPLEGAPSVDPPSVRYFLLDGQQRATALFHALTGTGDVDYFIDMFDSETDEDGLPPLRWVRKQHRSPDTSAGAFSVAELIDENRFREMSAALPSEEALRLEVVRERRLGYLLRDQYSLTAIIMAENIELEALTRIFETLNRTGVRLDAFDLMVAVLYSPTFHLRDEWRTARDLHPILGAMETSGVEILKLVALWARQEHRETGRERFRRVTGVRQRDVLNIPSDFVKEKWHEAVSAYVEALDFLYSRAGISRGREIPSEAMVLSLAFQLSVGRDIAAIDRWYWRAIVTQKYAQGANTQVLSDVDHFESAFEGEHRALRLQLELALADQNRRNRILRLGLQGFLVREGAIDPRSGRALVGGPTELVSLSALLDERPYYSIGDSLVVDMLVCTPRTANELRRAARLKRSIPNLVPAVLESQGFPVDLAELPLEVWRRERINTLVSKMAVTW